MYKSNRVDYFSVHKLDIKFYWIECFNSFDDVYKGGLIDGFQFCLYNSILKNVLLLTTKDHKMG